MAFPARELVHAAHLTKRKYSPMMSLQRVIKGLRLVAVVSFCMKQAYQSQSISVGGSLQQEASNCWEAVCMNLHRKDAKINLVCPLPNTHTSIGFRLDTYSQQDFVVLFAYLQKYAIDIDNCLLQGVDQSLVQSLDEARHSGHSAGAQTPTLGVLHCRRRVWS